MTKREASEKVAKLRKLAQGTASPHEAENARQAANKIVAEHDLSQLDLDAGEMAEAHDELLEMLETDIMKRSASLGGNLFGAEHMMKDVITKLKTQADLDKASRLRGATTLIRTAAFVAGDHPLVAAAKKHLDAVLKKHNLTL